MNSEGFFTTSDLDVYRSALDEIESYLKSMLYRFCSNSSVAAMSSSRIKKEKSIIDKVFRKKKSDVNIDVKSNISDIAGVRIVFCAYDDVCNLGVLDKNIHSWDKNTFKKKMILSSSKDENCNIDIIYDFVNFLKTDGSYQIILEKDYISEPKNSGYQSFHIIIRASNGCEVEIQVRNYVQHLFDEFEHEARYKADDSTRSEFGDVCSECADLLKSVTSNHKVAEHCKSLNLGSL